MPGMAMHHLIIKRIMSAIEEEPSLANLTADDLEKIRALLELPENLPYLYLGSQGPDFLFFNTRDWNPLIGNLAEIYFDVADFIDDFLEHLLKLVPDPVLDALAALDDLGEDVVRSSSTLTELSQLFGDMRNVLTGLLGVAEEGTKKYITDWVNPFDGLLSHPYRDGVPKEKPDDWWLFDALHYRKTGQFAKTLLESTADISSPKHLYAIGYLSHVGADTVGHAYVNAVSGGPYRSHAQRHRVAENFQDFYNYFLNTTAPLNDLNRSKLHELYNFNPTARFEIERINMPADLAALIADSINEIYQDDENGDGVADFGPRVTIDDIQDTYRLWYRWLRSATDTGTLPEPVAYSFSAEIREVWDQAGRNLDSIGDFLNNAVNRAGSGGILAILGALAALVIAAVAAALAVVDFVLGAIATLSAASIRAAAYLIYDEIYNAFQQLRLALSLNGLSYPMFEHKDDPRFSQFKDPSQPDSTNTTAEALRPFHPLHRWPLSEAAGFPEKHLIYPPTRVTEQSSVPVGEMPSTWPCPTSYYGEHADWYGWGDVPFDPSLLDNLAMLQETDADNVRDRRGRPSDHQTETKALFNDDGKLLGSGVSLTLELYARIRAGQPIPDFNLDSDCGYGYLCWTQTDDLDDPNAPSRLVVQPTENASAAETLLSLGQEIKLTYIHSQGRV